MLVGVILLLNNLGYVAGQFWGILWPSLLIIGGVRVLFGKKHFSCKDCWTLNSNPVKGGKKKAK